MSDTDMKQMFETVLAEPAPPTQVDVQQVMRSGRTRWLARLSAFGAGGIAVLVVATVLGSTFISLADHPRTTSAVDSPREKALKEFEEGVGNLELHDEDRYWIAQSPESWAADLEDDFDGTFSKVDVLSSEIGEEVAKATLVGSEGGIEYPMSFTAMRPESTAMDALRDVFVDCRVPAANVSCVRLRGIRTGEPYVRTLLKAERPDGPIFEVVGVGDEGVTTTLTIPEVQGNFPSRDARQGIVDGFVGTGPYLGLFAPKDFSAPWKGGEADPEFIGSISLAGAYSGSAGREWLDFTAHWHDGRVTGESKCGDFSGSYELSGASLSVTLGRDADGNAFSSACEVADAAATALESTRYVGINVDTQQDFVLYDSEARYVADMYIP